MSEQSPDAAFLIIGNEILSGRTRETNLQSLAQGLRTIGRKVAETRVVRDERDAIVEAVNDLRRRHSLVFTSGGIGPTHDDVTTACIADAFGVPVIRHPLAEESLRKLYEATGREATEERLSMADVPKGSELVVCGTTAAPGYRIENVYVFAGVPYIFTEMLEVVMGELEARPELLSRTIIVDVGESEVAGDLASVQQRHKHLELGSYPQDRNGHHFAELVISGNDPEAIAKAAMDLTECLDKRGVQWRE